MTIDFNKNGDGLVPVIVQDNTTKTVLMLGYMNDEAFEKTKVSGLVTFFSRSKNRLWTKGETSGNVLKLIDMKVDGIMTDDAELLKNVCLKSNLF